jgi:hypothetical protein
MQSVGYELQCLDRTMCVGRSEPDQLTKSIKHENASMKVVSQDLPRDQSHGRS